MRHQRRLGMSMIATLSYAMTALGTLAQPADDFYGTYRLVKTERKILETGEIEALPGEQGLATYGRDGRMLLLLTRGARPKAESVAKMTDQQHIELFRSMTAYGGTYNFDGKVMEYKIDISWNEVWSGTTQIRDARFDGERLILSTRPGPSGRDGRVSVTVLEWVKVK
jgi:hypothetical protein